MTVAPCPTLSTFTARWREWGGPRDVIATLAVPGDCASVRTIRALILLDWRIRVAFPRWCAEVPELRAHAEKLRALDPLWKSTDAADAVAAAATAAVATAAAAAAAANPLW